MTNWGQANVGGTSPALLVQAGSSPVLLNNTDQNNTVWLSDDQFGLAAIDTSKLSPLPPLGSVTFDGTASVWGICPAGQSALVSRYPGGLNFFQLVELLVKTLLISGAAGNGAYLYSGAPGPGDLKESAAAFDGSDPFNNHVFNGWTSYSGNGNTDLFMALRQGGLVWGTNQNGPGGTGAVSIVDAITLRIQQAIVATDPNSPLTAEGWHTITPDAGWTVATDFRLKLLAEKNLVYMYGDLTHAAITAATNINGSNPVLASYRPSTTRSIGGPLFPAGRCSAEITTGGVIIAEPLGASVTGININGIYPLD